MAKQKKSEGESIASAMSEVLDMQDPLFPNGLLGEITTTIEEDEDEIIDETQLEAIEEENEKNELKESKSKVKAVDIEIPAETEDTEDSTIKILANYLRDEGIVEFNDEDFEDDESFINKVIEDRIDQGIEGYKAELPPVIQDLINNYEEGVPLGELLGVKTYNEDFLKLNKDSLADNEIKQKSVVREYYKRLGWKDEKIDAKIEKLESRADLEDTSVELLEELQEILKYEEDNYKLQQKQAEQSRIAQFEEDKRNFKAGLEKREEVFPGLKLTTKQKEELYKGIWEADKEGKNELVKKIEKDKDFNLKVAYMTLILDWDLSALEKIANTKAAKGLRNAIEAGKVGLKGIGSNAKQTNGEKFDSSIASKAVGR